MKVMITGTADFIRSALALRLLEWNDTIDRHRQPRSSNTNYTHLCVNLAYRKVIGETFATHEPQRIVNLAAQAGVRHSIENLPLLAYIGAALLACPYPRSLIWSMPQASASMVPTQRCPVLINPRSGISGLKYVQKK